jgi:HAE1 family hydrophobic/amphiphilic exporter-1
VGIISFAIQKPVTVIVGVVLLGLFGFIAAASLPVQLTPDVDQTLITVTTRWASP